MGPSSETLPSGPSSFCKSCWEGPFAAQLGLFGEPTDWRTPKEPSAAGYSYLVSWTDLESRAAAGCSWCTLVLGTCSGIKVSTAGTPLTITVGKSTLLNRKFTPPSTQGLSIIVNGMYHYSAYVYTAADDPAADCIVARKRILDVGSPGSLALAKACVDGCVNGHTLCDAHPLAPETALPTRLIDCSDPDRPRLVSTHGTHGTYVALSYVWAEAQPHSTTVANIFAHTCGIDIARLPRTIRDAIHVTRALGYRFLWVDSLCIMQDSDEDKQREIGRMRHIYRDARLTVIASCARRVGEGFLHERSAIPETGSDVFSRDIALPLICPQDTSTASENAESQAAKRAVGTVYLSPISTASDPFGYALLPYNPAQEPTGARGWCMQEYFMSPRALIFASHTVLFRCQTETVCVGGAVHDSYFDRRLPPALFRTDTPPVAHGSEEWRHIHETWLVIVKDYTRRATTDPSDKLVACAGIAEEFQRVLRSEYLAGLWRKTLLEDLLWMNHDRTRWLSRPAAYRAPSWSWAAVDGEVFATSHSLMTPVAEVTECKITLEDDASPFGRVAGGRLALRTVLLACVLSRKGTSHHHVSLQFQIARGARRSRGEGGGEDGGGAEADSAGNAGVATLSGVGNVDTEEDADVQNAWVVLISARAGLAQGLMVVPADSDSLTPTRGRGVYRRIGCWKLSSPMEFELVLGWISEQPFVEIDFV